MGRRLSEFDEGDRSRIIEMAWEDRTPFEAIEAGYGLDESEVIRFMRRHMTGGSFRLWRRRVTSRATKHVARRPAGVTRAHCPTQYKPRSR